MKRVAVATNDGESISSHFGRSAAFIVFDADERGAVRSEVRQNLHACGEHTGCGHGHDHATNAGHAGLLSLLQDCCAVIAGGMGRRAAEELHSHGVDTVMVDVALTPRDAVLTYLSGAARGSDGFCHCSH